MNKVFCRYLMLVLFLSFLLSGCATTTQPFSQQAFNHNQWSLQGKIAIRTQSKGETASLFWQQRGNDYSMRLFGPLGIGAVQLHGEPGQVTLLANDGKVYQAKTPEALIQQTLGWQLPVSNLTYWIRGEKAPHYLAKTQYDQQHHLIYIQQQGWRINYLSYNPNGLPRLVNGAQGPISFRIVIDEWGG